MEYSAGWIRKISGITAVWILLSGISFAKEHKIQGSIQLKGKETHEYTTLAKISLQEAMVRASAVVPGKFVEIVLEEEDGFLIYEAEIVTPDNTRKEIVIDAGNGAVLLVKEKDKKKT